MKQVEIGRTGVRAGAVGLGCMSFGGIYGETDEAESSATLARAWDLGVTHLDVADIYGGGLCEEIVGRYLKDHPGQTFSLATKGAIITGPPRAFANDRAYLEKALDASLKRLGVDHVDLYYIHRRDPRVEIEEVMETMLAFRKAGKIGGIGLSEIAPSTLERASAVGQIDAVQNEYPLWTRLPELGLLEACRRHGTTFVSFSPVARGALTDNPPDSARLRDVDFRKHNPRFQQPNWSANLAYIERARAFARDHGMALSTLAIAWTLARAPGSLAIPGTRTAAHLEECARAAEVEMSDAMIAELETILPAGFAHGPRYSEAQGVGPEIYC